MRAVRALAKKLLPAPLRGALRAMMDDDKQFAFAAYFRPDIHQTTALTFLDRYPQTFQQVQQLVSKKHGMRILSFGCSTGEEVVTLGTYFPDSQIVGAEINRRRLRVCRERKLGANVTFVRSTPRNIARLGPFDVIFAMAVLQKLPHVVQQSGTTNIARLYPFAKFETQVTAFDSWLKPDGLIVIRNAQYRFSDCAVADRYETCGCRPSGAALQHFDKNGDLLNGEKYIEVIFRKR